MTYADLHSSVKDEIREKLFRIQHGLCAYCEERVTIEKTKIEHFHPQNPVVEPTAACAQQLGVRNNELARADVLWKNMLLCCLGGEGSAAQSRRCDTKKGNIDICARLYNLREVDGTHLSTVRVNHQGAIVAHYFPGEQQEAQYVIDHVLNLNLQQLKDNRLTVMNTYLKVQKERLKKNQGAQSNQQVRDTFKLDLQKKIRDGVKYPSVLATLIG